MQRDVQFMANLAIACMHIDKMMLPVCFLIWKSFRFEFQLSNAKTRHYLKWHCQFLCSVIHYPISPYVPYALIYLILISNCRKIKMLWKCYYKNVHITRMDMISQDICHSYTMTRSIWSHPNEFSDEGFLPRIRLHLSRCI